MRIKQDGQYLSFVLDKTSDFYMTGYRILRKQADKGLLYCEKIWLNGCIKLLYPISRLSPLSYDVFSWKKEQVLPNIQKIVSVLKDFAANGFLQPETIRPELDHMYIEKATGRIFLVALPLNMNVEPAQHREWFSSLKKSLISLIEFSEGRDDDKLIILKNEVIRSASSLEELCGVADRRDKAPRKLSLTLMSSSRFFCLTIEKDEFVIGKLKDSVDGLIDFTPTISRRHCQVTRRGDVFHIQDLNSANHTYVNGVMVPPGKLAPVKNGDHVRLAELDFSVKYI